MNWPLWIWIANVVSTLFLVGLIWTVQIVHYPSFAFVSESAFAEFEAFHQRQISFIVVPVMLIELLTTTLLLLYRPAALPLPLLIAGAVLLGMIWSSTFLLQVPIHTHLSSGSDDDSIRRLVRTNWLRTAAWSGRGVLIILSMVYMLHPRNFEG